MSSQWVDVAAENEVSDQPLAVFENGVALIVVRCGAAVYAVDNMCTHDGETLGEAQVEDCQVICPRHGAHFCLKTGTALTPPAYEALRTYPARVDNGRVLVELPG
jgi:3-phenylpropionate/trans-cinnamate dioxygenase ferredoxin component